jgi:hypothetical protein
MKKDSNKSQSLNKRKIGEIVHRLIGFSIFQSLIVVICGIGIYNTIQFLIEVNNLNFGTRMGMIQALLATLYLSIANLFYWLMGINLFDFKKLWRKNEIK